MLQYLNGSPAAAQTAEGVKECFQYLDTYKLTKAEKLQVVNLYPTSEVDVHLVILCPLLPLSRSRLIPILIPSSFSFFILFLPPFHQTNRL